MACKTLSSYDNTDGALARAFLSLINVLILQKSQLMSTSEESYPKDCGEKLIEGTNTEFDFIVVGSGTAGSLVARRISDFTEFKVLLLEAGSLPSATSNVPYVFYTLPYTREDWKFETDEQSNVCQGYEGKSCTIHKGKIVGGTSSINNMHYLRANERDFDSWTCEGAHRWDLQSLEPIYRTLEGCQKGDCSGFGTNGDVILQEITDREHYFLEFLEQGIKEMENCSDFDPNTNLGYFHTKAYVQNGLRNNFAKSFLSPIKKRSNLYFAQNATVLKVLFRSNSDKKAVGVKLKIGKKVLKVRAKREIILAAGAINTPKILMMSGIGKAKHLKKIGIETISDIPVGENLQIQMAVPIFVGLKLNVDESRQRTEVIDSIYEYVMYKKGKVAKTNVHGFVGFLNLRSVPYDYPNIQIYHYYLKKNDLFLKDYLLQMKLKNEIIKSIMNYNDEYSILVFMPTLIKPKSIGKILLNQTNLLGNPIVKANFFSDTENEDLHVLQQGVNYVKSLVKTKTFKKCNAVILNIDIPNCRNYNTKSDYYTQCIIKNVAYPLSNVVGTTKMGMTNDPVTVVDGRMLVKGVRGLRVVDASVFPEMVSGNTQATEAVVAERAAEYMREKWMKNYDKRGGTFCRVANHPTCPSLNLYECQTIQT